MSRPTTLLTAIRRLLRLRDDSGQSTVEAAIVLPAMTFLTLLTMQLTMVQHARIMTDYAAFCAARAGSVFNGNNTAMVQAASVALAPTVGRADSMSRLQSTMNVNVGYEIAMRNAIASGLPFVSVETLRPTGGQVGQFAGPTGGVEMDFDDIRPAAASANLLQIRVHYYYDMKIPFANMMLQAVYFAQKAQLWTYMDASHWGANMAASKDVGSIALSQAAGAGGSSDNDTANTFRKIVQAAQSNPPQYYFPLEATYSMRMQSNFFQKNAQN